MYFESPTVQQTTLPTKDGNKTTLATLGHPYRYLVAQITLYGSHTCKGVPGINAVT